MTQANTKWMWAALLVGSVVAASPRGAEAQYVKDTTNGFSTLCDGTPIPDAEFTDSWGLDPNNVRPLLASRFSGCHSTASTHHSRSSSTAASTSPSGDTATGTRPAAMPLIAW